MNLEIFSDLICPWCYIGKKRLDLALQSEQDVDVVWRAYQLYPGIPEQGMTRSEFMQRRYADADQTNSRKQIEAEAAGVGIELQFERTAPMPNTFKGHRLLHRARETGVQHQLAESLFSAYFERGLDIGSADILQEIAVSHGMDPDATAEFLAGDAGADAVRAEIERAANIGVTGVPCFILAGTFALPGAQEPEVIKQIIQRAKTKLADAL